MVARLERKTPRRTSRGTRKFKRRVPTVSKRAVRAGRIVALGSLVAAGMLVVIGVGAVVLLATEPSGKRKGGWSLGGLSNSARDQLRSNIPPEWRKAVREDFLRDARDFVARQAQRFS